MNVVESLNEKRAAVEDFLSSILSQENTVLFQAMRYTVFSGGKRFRPLLALCSAEYFRVDQEEVLPFASALELIHNYSLIHDDLPLMDDDDFRRGKPSSHRVFGEAVALLAGDSLLTLAFEVMVGALAGKGSMSRKARVIKEISECAGAKGMIGGQVIDITFEKNKVTKDRMHELIQKKTGALITASVKTGAILGDASPRQLEALTHYGRNVGFAFQVRDDILDRTAEGSDASDDEPNYALFVGLEESKRRLKEFVNDALHSLENASLDSEELRYLARMLLDVEGKKE
ncbi:MAG: polyprenyl synthetase family protein [Candidatus Aminicenantales bacterium]